MSTSTMTQAREQPASTTKTPDEDPKLSLEVLTRPCEKIDALKLIGDSIAQQRQVASQHIIFHPLCLAGLVGVVAVCHVTFGIANDDYAAMLLTYSGLVLTYLLAIRYITSAYIDIAEDMDWNTWLKGPGGKDDIIFGARYGTEIVAALVLRLPNKSNAQDKVALVRAWTTVRRYRGRGLGGDMLREAVKHVRQTKGRECDVQFAEDHAHSKMPLRSLFNEPFRARNAQTFKALKKTVAKYDSGSQ